MPARLLVARGATGVAKARRQVLVKCGPDILVGMGSNPGFVACRSGMPLSAGSLSASHSAMKCFTVGNFHGDRLDQRQKGQRRAESPIFRVDDPGQLLRVQTRVEGAVPPAGAGHAVVKLEMAVAVPASAPTRADWRGLRRARWQSVWRGGGRAVGAMNIALHAARHHPCRRDKSQRNSITDEIIMGGIASSLPAWFPVVRSLRCQATQCRCGLRPVGQCVTSVAVGYTASFASNRNCRPATMRSAQQAPLPKICNTGLRACPAAPRCRFGNRTFRHRFARTRIRTGLK